MIRVNTWLNGVTLQGHKAEECFGFCVSLIFVIRKLL